MRPEMVTQMKRQALWLKDSWLWLLRERVFTDRRLTALDVGCGPGYVMDVLKEHFDVVGVDIDPDMVKMCRSRGLRAYEAPAERLPFEDESFDVVYCSFLLMWVSNPALVIREMSRVAGSWVICLGEPDYGSRIDYPEKLEPLAKVLIQTLEEEGADPFVGRKLRSIFRTADLHPDIGVHAGVWDIKRLKKETEAEWQWLKDRVPEELKGEWDEAIEKGMLFQYNPIFYAFARK